MKNKKIVRLHKKNIVGQVLISILILFLTGILILMFSPFFNIKVIKVEGISRLNKKDIIKQSELVVGQNILRLNKFKIEEKIEELTYVKEAELSRNWPNEIDITIKEKIPVAGIEVLKSVIVIDEGGFVLEELTDKKTSDIPIVSGLDIKKYGIGSSIICANDNIKENILRVLKTLKNNDMLNNIEKLEIDNKKIFLYGDLGYVANLGDTSDIDYKIQRLKAVAQLENSACYFDISNVNIPVTSKPLYFDENNKIVI